MAANRIRRFQVVWNTVNVVGPEIGATWEKKKKVSGRLSDTGRWRFVSSRETVKRWASVDVSDKWLLEHWGLPTEKKLIETMTGPITRLQGWPGGGEELH